MTAKARWAPSRKVLATVLVVVLVAVIALGATFNYLMSRAVPSHSGTETLSGLSADVEVIRDELGVPHIYATTDADLMAALGYVHAQDRFFEMDYRRAATAGRVSELVGDQDAAMAADQVTRTFGWRQVAEEEWDLLTEETRGFFEAYTDGVNAYISERDPAELALEYTALGLQVDVGVIEEWDPIDSLAWLKAMAWDLRGNYNDEVSRATILRALFGDVDRVESLFPDPPTDTNLPIIPGDLAAARDGDQDPEDNQGADGDTDEDSGEDQDDDSPFHDSDEAPTGDADALSDVLDLVDETPEDLPDDVAAIVEAGPEIDAAAAALDALPELIGSDQGVGSNSFVISGEHTDTGEPILANDPHLGLEQPNLWYQVGLHCVELTDDCTFDVSGFSFAGLPGVVIGSNTDLSWGLTNLGADVIDLTLERVFADDTYLRGDERVPLERRTETIEVNGGQSQLLDVAETHNGPIISNVMDEVRPASSIPLPGNAPAASFDGYAVSIRWTALEPGRSGDAIFALNRASDAEDIAGAAELFEVPSQNIVFATADGDIGSQAPGLIPLRDEVEDAPLPADGSWPRPGWDPAYDWQGYVEPEDMPAVVNPDEGFIVAANQPAQPPGEGPHLTEDFGDGYRAQRIRELIEADIDAGNPISVERANEIMTDDASPFGPIVVPYLLDAGIEDPFILDGLDLLEQWADDGYPTDVDSAGAAYFNAVWAEILDLTFLDELPNSEAPSGASQWLNVMTTLLDEPNDPWWDDRTTVNVVESRDEILTQALSNGRMQLTASVSKDPDQWRWGDLHQFEPEHAVLGGDALPGFIQWVFNAPAVEVPGGSAIPNAMNFNAGARDAAGRTDFSVTSGPSMRMVVSLADLDDSIWVTSSGTSGHPGSSHYDDQLEAWARSDYFEWPFSRDAVEEAEANTLMLEPGEPEDG